MPIEAVAVGVARLAGGVRARHQLEQRGVAERVARVALGQRQLWLGFEFRLGLGLG